MFQSEEKEQWQNKKMQKTRALALYLGEWMKTTTTTT